MHRILFELFACVINHLGCGSSAVHDDYFHHNRTLALPHEQSTGEEGAQLIIELCSVVEPMSGARTFLGATALHVAIRDCRSIVISYRYIYIIVVNSALDFNLSHVRLVHAQDTELKEVGAQQRFREEARYVAISANEFDTDLAALGVVTVFEESNIEVLAFPQKVPDCYRGEDASQVAAVDWRRRNEHSIRPTVSGRFFVFGHHVKSGNTRNAEATLKQ